MLELNDSGKSVASSFYDGKKPTRIFAHGYTMNGYDNQVVIDMKNGIATVPILLP